MSRLILASGSEIRASLLRNAGVTFDVSVARVDEQAIKQSLVSEGANARDLADALAEVKARNISQKNPTSLVLGCDQVLDHSGTFLSKATSPEEAVWQLSELSGSQHNLLSAAVLYDDGKPLWRFVGKVRLTMRQLSEDYIRAYVDRNWDEIQYCVGCYQLEHEGIRLFSRVEGDYFHVLGLPLIEVLNHLTLIGEIEG